MKKFFLITLLAVSNQSQSQILPSHTANSIGDIYKIATAPCVRIDSTSCLKFISVVEDSIKYTKEKIQSQLEEDNLLEYNTLLLLKGCLNDHLWKKYPPCTLFNRRSNDRLFNWFLLTIECDLVI